MPDGIRALEHIRLLTETIGPRPTGSPAEAAALARVELFFQGLNIEPTRFPVREIRPPQKVSWFGLFVITLFTAQVMIIEVLPWLPLVTFLALRVLVMPLRRRIRQRPQPGGPESFNVIAEQPAVEDSRATLVIGAHIDTAPAATYHRGGWHARLRQWFGFKNFARAFWVLVAIFFIQYPLRAALDESTADTLIFLMFSAVKLFFVVGWLYGVSRFVARFTGPEQYAPGANDNASGVAAVMTLAEYFKQNRPRHLTLRYMVFCAEEVGLIGSKRYADRLSEAEKQGLYMLNLDMVATGETVRYNRSGTDKQLNVWLREAGAEKGSLLAAGSSDYRSFADQDIPAAGLYNTGEDIIFRVYHSTGDTMAHVRAKAIEKTLAVAQELVQKLDTSLNPSASQEA